MSVTVYKSSDSGAPSLTRTAGSFISLLDAVLVSGYGSQSSCGWTKQFTSGTTKAVYKAPTAIGNFSMFVEDDVTAANYFSNVRFAETALSINTDAGIFWPIGNETDYATTQDKLWNAVIKTTTNLATSTAIRWSFINNTNKGMYFWIDINNETAASKPSYGAFHFIVKPTMLYRAYAGEILTGFRWGNVTWNNIDLTYPSTYSAPDMRYCTKYLYNYRGRNYDTYQVDYAPTSEQITGGPYIGSAASANYGLYPHIDGNMLVTDVIMNRYNRDGYPILKLPGVLQPLHNIPLNQYDTIAGSAPFASSNYTAWCANGGQVLIDTTDNW